MRNALAILLVGWLGVAVAPGTVMASPLPPSATQPAGAEVSALVARLGDPDFRVRRDASAKLRELGPAALPELREATQDANPEIRARAAQLVRLLDRHPVPGRPPFDGLRRRVSTTRIENGRRTVDVDDFGRRIHLVETDDGGIEMTINGETDGRPDTQTYTAKTSEELRAENPEAYAVYARVARTAGTDPEGFNGNVIIRGNGNLIFVPQQAQALPFILPRVGDDLAGLRARLDDQMNKSNLAPMQKARVHNAIDRVQQSSLIDPAAVPLDATEDHIARYDKACDELRKLLKDLNLPDPGEALPPPKGARLGVSVAPDPLSGAVVVSQVMPKSRAERLGLQADDVIHKVNGKPVADVTELRRLVTDNPKGLVVDLTRDGRDLTLSEPK